uniref:Integrase catalytic domain-containing protein n=1 Tax=Nelumbo nucifera TaxID=4432 RepID=A0A822ZV31_NELNU|nr:TPA_asm: hypothetical protein HUJ06_003978 [Nelumbo nucifera]
MNGGSVVSNICVDKLVGNNYSYWKLCMEAYLQGQDLWDLIASDEVVIPADNPQNAELRQKWKIKCGKALFALRTPISKEYIEHVHDLKSPKQLWETLEILFTQKNTMRLQFLENELTGMIQGWAKQPSIIELENLLSNQEALVKQMTNNSLSKVEDALHIDYQRKKNFSSKHNDSEQTRIEGQSKGNSKACYRCGKPGHIRCHIQRNCRVNLNEEGANVTHENNESEWERCLFIEDIDQPVNVTSVVHRPMHLQTNALTDVNVVIDFNKEWIVDSGCSHHATGNASLLSDVRPHCGKRTIVTADNSLHPVVREGIFNVIENSSIDEGLSLKDVYHVPGLKKNLASVSQITDSGRYVLFGPNNVQILSNVKHIEADILFTGKRKESLYVLSANDAYVKKTGQNASAALWHARLGHIGYQLLQKISSQKLLDGIPIFKDFHHDMVYFMGPTKTPSYSGLQYVMIFVDDFLRFTWVYFLEHKSEAFSKFIQFKQLVEKEFELKIKCLRTDNGGECVQNPTAKRGAERKLAHLTSMCLSWLHTKKFPRELWAAAIQSACYVINRLPPWPGKESSPFEKIYHQKPNVSNFRVFGSVCYVHVTKNNRSKPEPRARRCIFVGYDTCRKGWRCMDPKTKKIIVSRDVVFNEVSSYESDVKEGKRTDILAPLFDNAASNERDEPMIRKSSRQRKQPDYLADYEVQLNHCSVLTCFLMADSCENEPRSYNETKEEISALNKNCTWELVPKPKNADVVTCKWVYKLKKKVDGTVDKHKARLVARGFSQQYGLDYDETFSPIAKMPHGFISKEFPNHVCRLKKALYGLKQAPRAWYGKIAQYLDFCGFKSSSADPSLFVKKTSTICTMLLLYVDDMIITGDNSIETTRLRDDLSIHFEMKSLAEASCFLGLEVEESNGYFVSQKGYAAGLLNRFGMGESKAMTTPMESCLKLTKDEGRPLKDATLFRQLVGSLFYLTITRPDIAYSVGVISQLMEKPCEGHLIAAKRILRYIKGTLHFGLMYKQHIPFSLNGFAIAAISWCSKKQTIVALSSCEAEYVAATMATQECLWLKRLIQEIFPNL